MGYFYSKDFVAIILCNRKTHHKIQHELQRMFWKLSLK